MCFYLVLLLLVKSDSLYERCLGPEGLSPFCSEQFHPEVVSSHVYVPLMGTEGLEL